MMGELEGVEIDEHRDRTTRCGAGPGRSGDHEPVEGLGRQRRCDGSAFSLRAPGHLGIERTPEFVVADAVEDEFGVAEPVVVDPSADVRPFDVVGELFARVRCGDRRAEISHLFGEDVDGKLVGTLGDPCIELVQFGSLLIGEAGGGAGDHVHVGSRHEAALVMGSEGGEIGAELDPFGFLPGLAPGDLTTTEQQITPGPDRRIGHLEATEGGDEPGERGLGRTDATEQATPTDAVERVEVDLPHRCRHGIDGCELRQLHVHSIARESNMCSIQAGNLLQRRARLGTQRRGGWRRATVSLTGGREAQPP